MNHILLSTIVALCGLGAAIPSWAVCWIAPRECCRQPQASVAAVQSVRSCCQAAPRLAMPGCQIATGHSERCCCDLSPTAPAKQPVSFSADTTLAAFDLPLALAECIALPQRPTFAAAHRDQSRSLQILLCVWRC